MKKFNPLTRSRNWSCVCYSDPSVSLSSLLSQASQYVYIFHDKDEGKAPHYHLLLFLKNAKTASALLSYNTSEQNMLCEPVIDRLKVFRYLRHLDHPGRYQYPLEALKTPNLDYWLKLDSNSDFSPSGENTLAILDDIIHNRPLREMIGVYGRDYVIHYDAYQSMAYRLKLSDHFHKIDPPGNFTLVDDDEFPF